MKITFAKPLEFEGQHIDFIVLAEPTAGQVLAAERARVAETGEHSQRVYDTVLIAKVSGISEDLVRKMPASKFQDAGRFLNRFNVPAKAEKNLDPELVIDIPKIEKGGRIVTALELREPTTGEVEESQRKMGASYTTASMREGQIHLVCLVAELPRHIVESVPVSKLNQASQYLLGFI